MMTALTLTDRLRAMGACSEAIDWVEDRGYTTIVEVWEACPRGDWMIWLLTQEDAPEVDDRTLRIFACRCVRQTPIAGDRTVWDLLTDERSRRAVEVAERYAVGDASDEELRTARAAAEYAARAAAEYAAEYAARAAARSAAWGAARAARNATECAAQILHANLLREMIPIEAIRAWDEEGIS